MSLCQLKVSGAYLVPSQCGGTPNFSRKEWKWDLSAITRWLWWMLPSQDGVFKGRPVCGVWTGKYLVWHINSLEMADSVDLLLDSFNSKVKNVIDDIAPIKVSKKNGRQKSFWRKSTAVQNMKRQCRKAERMWWKTKLEIHYSIYKDGLHAFNLELATARQTFFSNLINSNLNITRTLFATVERRTNPPSQIPSEMLSDSKCNEFASFFSEKIGNIRKEIGTSSCNTEVTQIRQQSQKEVTMSVFKTIDSKILDEMVQHLKSSTCYLDTLPTYFFKSVLNCLEADLIEVVNTSLLSGTFPNSLKTTVVKPLLKKRYLEHHVEQL